MGGVNTLKFIKSSYSNGGAGVKNHKGDRSSSWKKKHVNGIVGVWEDLNWQKQPGGGKVASVSKRSDTDKREIGKRMR